MYWDDSERGDCCVGGKGDALDYEDWIMSVMPWEGCAALPWIAGVSSGVEVVGVGSGDLVEYNLEGGDDE